MPPSRPTGPPSPWNKHFHPELIKRIYQALWARARNILLQAWGIDAPTHPYYKDLPTLSPHPFMGLGKFVAGRIHQMRAAKSYLAAHPSLFDENPDTTCPRCGIEPESFELAILTCPARSRVRDLKLKEVSSLEHDAPLWTELHVVRALGEYIPDTKTGFPPDMTSDLSPPQSPLPPT